jgi:hypothetical protein
MSFSRAILPTKKDITKLCIMAKFSVFCEFPHNFHVMFYQNFTEKNLLKSCKTATPKKYVQKTFLFYRNYLHIRHFLSIHKTGFFSFFDAGTVGLKPGKHIIWKLDSIAQ